MDTWEIILLALIRILREHLPAELARHNVKPLDQAQVHSSVDALRTADSILVSHISDSPQSQDEHYVDATIEYEVEISRFGPRRGEIAALCSRTKAAVVRVLRDHMGLDTTAQTELSQGFQTLRIGDSEPATGQTKTAGFLHAVAFPIYCDVRSSRRADGSAPDL